MGSEMCIRDSDITVAEALAGVGDQFSGAQAADVAFSGLGVIFGVCLLYTSDAADERSSVDLGGRRIIKKKKHISACG